MKTYYAVYRLRFGDRRINDLLRSAGLGVEGNFRDAEYTVNWKEGELVDDERAEKLCEVIKGGYKNTYTECHSVKFSHIYTKEGTP